MTCLGINIDPLAYAITLSSSRICKSRRRCRTDCKGFVSYNFHALYGYQSEDGSSRIRHCGNRRFRPIVLQQLLIRALLRLSRSETCPKLLHDILVRQIHRLLALGHLLHLRIASHERQPKFPRLDFGYYGALHLTLEDVLAERQFLAQKTAHPHAVDCGESLDHSPHGAETTGDVCSGLGQARDDDVGEIHEKGLALLGRLSQMDHEPLLISAAGQLDEVDLVDFQRGAELPRLFGLKPRFLKLGAVDLDADDKILGDPGANGVTNLEDQPHAVFERAAVLVGTSIGLWAKELR